MAFPQMFFSAAGGFLIVASQAEADALPAIWAPSPADWGLITAPSVAQAAANSLSASTLFPLARQLTADTVRATDRRTRPATLGF